MATEPTFGEKFRYRFDNFMAKGGWRIFLALLVVFLIALAIIGGLRMLSHIAQSQTGDEREMGVIGQIYISWLQMTDPGNMAQDIKSTSLYKITAIIAGAVGVVIFSMLIGLITTTLDQRIAALRKGHSRVIEEDHTLILGWNEQRVTEILREITLANESEDNPSAVVLADKPKEDMDDYLTLMGPDPMNTRFITRSGSPSSIVNLKIASVDKCRSVIVLASAKDGSTADEKASSDAAVVKTIMAAAAAAEGREGELDIVADIFDDHKREIIQSSVPFPISVVDSTDVLAKIIVQTSRSVGLSVVYNEILSFDGCEMYFHGDKRWGGKTWKDLAFHFPDGVPMGIRTADGELKMNPDPDSEIQADDEILIVADDDSTIEYLDSPVAQPEGGITKIVDRRLQPDIENELFIGWNRKGAIMAQEYADYVVDGSSIDIIVRDPSDGVRAEIAALDAELEGLKMTLVEGDPLRMENLAALEPHKRNNIILLSDVDADNDAEQVDSRSIMILLLLRRLFDEAGTESIPQLITEVMDSNNQNLVSSAGVRDFIVSDKLVSMLLAQMSEDADIKSVYDDLFQEDGSEIYLKPLSLYLEEIPSKLSFADCMRLAQLREEVCIGIKKTANERNPDENFGVQLIPLKDDSFEFGPSDCLVVLAEDET